jgi:hypothetical protein
VPDKQLQYPFSIIMPGGQPPEVPPLFIGTQWVFGMPPFAPLFGCIFWGHTIGIQLPEAGSAEFGIKPVSHMHIEPSGVGIKFGWAQLAGNMPLGSFYTQNSPVGPPLYPGAGIQGGIQFAGGPG